MSHGAFGNRGPQGPSFTPYAHQEAVTALAASQNNFTRDLYMKLAKKNTGNLFYSPFSIMTALGMTYGGAEGNTKEEMRTAMHLSEDDGQLHDAFHDVISDMKTEAADYELRTSNLAYMSDRLTVLSEYEKILKEKYLSRAEKVDFAKSKTIRLEINDAVEKETNSRIKDLIPKGSLNANTRMVLVNAVYFKGLWAKQFSEDSTRQQEFWVSSNESINVPMMFKKAKFGYFMHRELGATLLKMDYQGSRLSMVIVLPNERDGLAGVEAKLADMNLSELGKNMHEIEVEVTIPKFKLEETLDLIETLQEMGIKDLFTEGVSNLSGMARDRALFVSKVIHKAFLEVNEQGSEAAAATGVVVQTRMLIRPIPPFIADHPFMFLIRDQRSGLVVFVGRLLKP